MVEFVEKKVFVEQISKVEHLLEEALKKVTTSVEEKVASSVPEFQMGTVKLGEENGKDFLEAKHDGTWATAIRKVTFEKPMRSIPLIFLSIVHFDASNRGDKIPRIHIQVKQGSVTATSFDLEISTWIKGGWIYKDFSVQWLAIAT
jgi:hypothetical protein